MSKLVSSVLKGLWVFLCNSSVLYIVTNNIMWIHCISGYKCHYIIYLTVPHACLGRDPWRDSMYSSEGTSVLVRNAWLIWLFTVKCFAFKWPWPWWGSLLVVWMCTVGGSGTKLQQRTNQKSLQNQKPDKNCRLRTQKNRGILFVYVPHWSALSPLQTSFWIKDRTSSDICVTACGPELCLQSLRVFLNVSTILHWSVQWCVQIHIDVNPHGNGLHSVSPP